MDMNDLSQYPSIRQLYTAHPAPPPISDSFLGHLYDDCHPIDFGIEVLDEAALVLLQAFPVNSLREHANAIFGPTIRDLEKAMTELPTLAKLCSMGVLDCVGWPLGAGDTPPFDGRIRDAAGGLIPFDIKSASNAGLYVLDRVLTPIAKQWANQHGIPDTEVTYNVHGTLTQPAVGPHVQALALNFTAQLAGHASFPPAPIQLQFADTTVDVSVTAPVDVAINIMGSAPRLVEESLRGTIRNHVISKSHQAQEADASIFLLLYARTFGAGMGDLRCDRFAHVMESVISDVQGGQVAGGERWGGCVLFDWSQNVTPNRWFALMPGAQWPTHSSADTFRQALSI